MSSESEVVLKHGILTENPRRFQGDGEVVGSWGVSVFNGVDEPELVRLYVVASRSRKLRSAGRGGIGTPCVYAHVTPSEDPVADHVSLRRAVRRVLGNNWTGTMHGNFFHAVLLPPESLTPALEEVPMLHSGVCT